MRLNSSWTKLESALAWRSRWLVNGIISQPLSGRGCQLSREWDKAGVGPQ